MKLRNWYAGDWIRPMGMSGHKKKLSDIMIDKKMNAFQKEDQLVLTDSSEEVIWMIGKKLSEKVKCDHQSSEFIHLKWTHH